MSLRSLSLFLLLLLSTLIAEKAQAQEVYFSISGQSVSVSSGDNVHQYDYWFRPAQGVTNPRDASIEIFDAGMGGFADVVIGQPNTSTTFDLKAFDELYTLGEQSVTRRNGSDTYIFNSITARDESRFLNRWVPFFTLSAPKLRDSEGPSSTPTIANGFIMRVSTDDGNDVNDFRIRITGEGAEDWELITMNLSVGLYLSGPANRFQFRPLWSEQTPPVFSLEGEEDSDVYLMDAFGDVRPVRDGWSGFESRRYGKDNTWAVVMTGSDMRINNRVLKGAENIVPFRFDPVILREEDPGSPEIRQVPTSECKVYGLESTFRGFSLDVSQTEWAVDDRQFQGASFQHEFGDFGNYPFRALIPTRGRHVPRYIVREGEVMVNTPPVAQVNNYRPIISPGERINLDASMSFDPDGRDLEYRWFVNNEFRSDAVQFAFSSSVSGRYDVRLVLSDNAPNASCTETVEYLPIVVNTQPYAEIGYPSVIASGVPAEVRVQNEFDTDNDELAFRWSGTGIQSGSQSRVASIMHDEPGNYTIQLTVDDQTGTANATYTTSATYKVNAAPVPVFDLPEFLAPGQPLTLDATESYDPDGDALTYRWEVSDGRTLRGSSHNITFDEPGSFDVTLYVNDGENVENSEQSLALSLVVNAPPVPVIASVDHTNNPIVDFDASDSSDEDQQIVSYEWDFGDGNTAEGARARHTFGDHGTFTVSLTVDDGTNVPNSRQTITRQVRVNKNPVARALGPSVVAPGQTFTIDGSESFDPDGTELTYSWTRKGRQIGTASRVELSLDSPGLHHIDLRVRDASPFDDAAGSITVPVRVNYAPVVKWTKQPEITEPGRETVFDASASYDHDNDELEIRWEFSDGTILEGARVTRTFDQPGTVFYKVHADDGEGLSNSVTTLDGSIRVNQSPIIVTETRIRSNSMTILLDASESYDPDGERLSYIWTLPDGTVRNEALFSWTAPEPGIHAISLRVDDGEGLENSTRTERIEVFINRPPVAVVDAAIESCTDQVIIFSSARSFDPDGDSFTTTWDFGDGNTSLEPNPVHSYSRPGFYLARLKLSDGFTDTPVIQEIPVTIEGSPQARIEATELTVCANSPVTFDGSGSTDPNGMIGSFSWDFGDMNTAVGERTTHLFTRPGTYRVTLTVTGSGTGNCPNISQTSALVTVVAAPRARFEIPQVIAPGEQVTLDAGDSESEDTIRAYRWTIRRNGETIQEVEGVRNTFRPTEPGRYEISLTIETENDAGCSLNTESRVLHVNAPPVATWNLPERWAQHKPFLLSAEGSADPDGFIERYTWLINGEEAGFGLTMPMPVNTYGAQQVELIIRDNNGVSNSETSISGEVYINPAPQPAFTLSSPVYLGEEVELRAEAVQDADGNAVESRWEIDGEIVAEGATHRFRTQEARYNITLIQDDGMGLANSVQRATRVLSVVQPPELTVTLPDVVVDGHELDVSSMNLPRGFVLLGASGRGADAGPAMGHEGVGGTPVTRWRAVGGQDGIGKVHVGWQPRGEGTQILATESFEVRVLEVLRAGESELRYSVAYNPLNSQARVRAPEVNRGEGQVLRFEWRDAQTGVLAGLGADTQLEVDRGTNRFELVIREADHIPGSSPIVIPVLIEVSGP